MSCSDSTVSYLVAIGVYHTVLLLWGAFLSYKTLNVNSVFSESKFVGIAMIANLQVLLLGGCVLAMMYENPVSGMTIKALIIFLNDMTIQTLIFGPKVYFLIKGVVDDGTAGAAMLAKRINETSVVSNSSAEKGGMVSGGTKKQQASPRVTIQYASPTSLKSNASPLSSMVTPVTPKLQK